MTIEGIIRMAKEAGFADEEIDNCQQIFIHFAMLVEEQEREACAKVCETHGVHPALNVWNGGPDWYKHGKDCAEAIRARGQA